MQSTFVSDGNILVVGDGDFSFTVALVKHANMDLCRVFTSNLETETSILHHAQASQNMSDLKELGVSVFLDTDATDLHNHPVISKESFDRVIFNFPLSDRHNIKKNRSLLTDFFSSCRSVLAPAGQVLVTLCKGQGGTPADQPLRSWHDCWQIVAMATNASFLLHEVLPFDPRDFPEYHSVGFRFQDKSFNVNGALTHVFEEGVLVEDDDYNLRGVLHRDGQSYSCSHYIASHLNRDLLQEAGNPVCKLRQYMEDKLKKCPTVKHLTIESGCSPIIPSHNSNVYFCKERAELNESIAANKTHVKMTGVKDWKNYENSKRMVKTQLAHGVMPDTSGVKTKYSVCFENPASAFIPWDKDNVYILVRPKVSIEYGKPCDGEDVLDRENGHVTESDISQNPNATDPSSDCAGSFEQQNEVGGEQSCSTEPSASNADDVIETSSPVYHCRTSLLENLPNLCQNINHQSGVRGECNRNNSAPILFEEDKQPSLTETSTSLPSESEGASLPMIPLHSISFPCLVTSGQSILPSHISPNSSPFKQEMIFLHLINDSDLTSLQREGLVSIPNPSHFDLVSCEIVSLLRTLCESLSTSLSLKNLSKDSPSYEIKIEGMDDSCLVSEIVITNLSTKDVSSPDQSSSDFSHCVGLMLLAKLRGHFYHVTLLDLQQLVCHICGIDDWRLLWSQNYKFLSQFQPESANISHCRYHPFSLYPMKFVHDLSFWEQTDSVNDFNIFDLYKCIRNVVGDLVNDVSLIDVYEDPVTKRRSRCYRLHFLSSDKCLSYITSWKMQGRIRLEVARSMGVQLR